MKRKRENELKREEGERKQGTGETVEKRGNRGREGQRREDSS